MTRFNLYKDGKLNGLFETKKGRDEIIEDIINRYGIEEATRYDVEIVEGVFIGEAKKWN